MKALHWRALALVLFALSLCLPVYATTYYVDGSVGNDSNAGTSAGSGNAWLTLGKAATTAVAGDTVYIKASATYPLTSSVAFTTAGSVTSGRIIFEGYTTTPGARDGRPVITSSTPSVALFTCNATNYVEFRHLKFTHTAATRGIGISQITANVTMLVVTDCAFDGCSIALSCPSSGNTIVFNGNEVKNGTTGGININGRLYAIANNIHDNTGYGVQYSSSANLNLTLENNLIHHNSSHGVSDTNGANNDFLTLIHNTIADNGGDGYRTTVSAGFINAEIRNNIIAYNGGYGIDSVTDNATENDARAIFNDYNAFYINTVGNRNNWPSGTHDITSATLTADPFTNRASGDYSLNNTAGGGAILRSTAWPGAMIGTSNTGYLDFGALQHQDSGGGTTPPNTTRQGGL